MIEYVLLVALVALVAYVGVRAMGNGVASTMCDVAGQGVAGEAVKWDGSVCKKNGAGLGS